MNIRVPASKAFEAGDGDSPENDASGTVPSVPPAFRALALSYAYLLNHTYGLDHLAVFPGRSDTLDDDTVYALTFHLEDAPDTERAQLEKFFALMDKNEHVIVVRDKSAIHGESAADLVRAYADIAKANSVSLISPARAGSIEDCDPDSGFVQKHYLGNLKKNPHALTFLHDEQAYVGATHLTRHFHRAYDARDKGHFIAVYSYRELMRFADDYDLRRDLHSTHTPRWQN